MYRKALGEKKVCHPEIQLAWIIYSLNLHYIWGGGEEEEGENFKSQEIEEIHTGALSYGLAQET